MNATAIKRPTGVYLVKRLHTAQGAAVMIKSRLGPAHSRKGLEKAFPSASEYAISELQGWQRAHSQGAGLGVESGDGLYLAPPLVNQILQNRGIERYLSELRDRAPDGALHLTTVTTAHPLSRRLRSIDYELAVEEAPGKLVTHFGASIEVQTNGTARAGVRLAGNDSITWGPWQR